MTVRPFLQAFLLLMTFTGILHAQEEAIDAKDLPPCDQELVDVLKNQQVNEGENPNKARDRKIVMSDLTTLISIHKKNVNCTFEVDGYLYSPLLYAVCMENPPAVKALINAGADVNFVQPERNVTALARVAWRSANKKLIDPKLWEDHFRMANDLIYAGAKWDYPFFMDIGDVVNGVQVVKEVETSIEIMNPDLIKDVLEYQSNDYMGRSPQAKVKIKKQKEKEARIAKRKHKKDPIKISF